MNKLKELMSKNFFKNVIVVSTGTLAAQVVTLIFAPIITRIYGPEAYGILGVFIATINIVAPIAALTYPIAIVLPKKDKEALNLAKISFYLSLILTLLTFLIIITFSDVIVNLLQIEAIASYIYLIPLVVLFGALMQIAEQWLIRKKLFKITAKVTFFQNLFINILKVSGGIITPSAIILVVLATMGNGLKALMFLTNIIRLDSNFRKEVFSFKVDFNYIKVLSRKYKDFPIYRAPQVFIDSITQSLPVIMLTMFFGPASAGFYSIGRTVLALPSQLVSKSVGDVFYPRISNAAHSGENLYSLIKRATLGLIFVGFFPFAVIILIGPWLFSFAFGEDWYTAGEYARWMAVWLYFRFINQPSIRAIPVLSAQRFHLIYTIFTLIVRSLALITGYYLFKNDIVSIMFFSLSGAILNIFLIAFTLRISKKVKFKS